MPRSNREHGLAPQEIGIEDKGNKQIEAGAHLEITENLIAKASRLFDQMNKDLREKRKQAKLEGKNEAEIKSIKFDKESPIYKEWISACSDNLYKGLVQEEERLHAQVVEVQEADGDINKNDLWNQYEKVNIKLHTVSAARNIRKELSLKIISIEDKIQDLVEKSDKLGGDNLAIDAEAIALGGAIDVAQAQQHVVEALAVGGYEDIGDLPPPIPTDYLEQFSSVDDLEEIIDDIDPNQQAMDMFFVEKNEAEASTTNQGAEKIRAVFSDLLAKDQKAKIGFREAIFSKKLNQLVGDDEVFAGLLLKNREFKNSVLNLFNAKVGVFGNKSLEAAARFVFSLEQARSFYDQIKDKTETSPTEEDQIEPETAKTPIKNTLVEDYFKSFGEFGIETPEKLKNSIDVLRSDMKIQRANLELQQDTLKQSKWYELNKKSLLKGQIKSTINEVAVLFEALVDLEGKFTKGLEKMITIEGINKKIYADADLTSLNSSLAEQIKQLKADVKSGKETLGSKNFFDRYTESAVLMLAAMSFVFSIVAVNSEKNVGAEKPSEKARMVKMVEKDTARGTLQSIMPDKNIGGMSYSLSDKPGMTMAEDMSMEPKPTPWGVSEEPVVETGYTSAEMVVETGENVKVAKERKEDKVVGKFVKPHKKEHGKRVVSSDISKVKSADSNKTEEELAKEFQTLNNKISEKRNQIKPPDFDNPDSLKQSIKDNNELSRLEQQRDAEIKRREDEGLKRITAQINKEDKVSDAAPMEKMAARVDYDSLNFSREYVGKLGTAHDIVREIQELAPVASASQKANFVNKAKSAIVQCEMFMAEKGRTKGELEEAEKVRKVASDQLRILQDNLPREKNVFLLAQRVENNINQLVNKFKSFAGSGREGVKVVGKDGALEKIQMITLNILATKEINNQDKVNLREARMNLDRLLGSEDLTSGEREAANKLIQAADVLLQGVAKSDKLWDIPASHNLDRAKQITLERDISSRASGQNGR